MGDIRMTEKYDEKDLIIRSIKAFGVDSQFRQFHEEIGELMVAISHLKRGRCTLEDLTVEIVDVLQMIDALKYVFGVDDDMFNRIKDQQWLKLQSQIEKIEMKKTINAAYGAGIPGHQ
jgi:NTP pyrophosphatase (non-canonical NTP hydrolase)